MRNALLKIALSCFLLTVGDGWAENISASPEVLKKAGIELKASSTQLSDSKVLFFIEIRQGDPYAEMVILFLEKRSHGNLDFSVRVHTVIHDEQSERPTYVADALVSSDMLDDYCFRIAQNRGSDPNSYLVSLRTILQMSNTK